MLSNDEQEAEILKSLEYKEPEPHTIKLPPVSFKRVITGEKFQLGVMTCVMSALIFLNAYKG